MKGNGMERNRVSNRINGRANGMNNNRNELINLVSYDNSN